MNHDGPRMIRRFAIFLLLLPLFLPGFPPEARAQTLPTLGSAPAEQAPAVDTQSLDELIRVLENEATRQRLIDTLKASAYRAPGEAAAAASGDAALSPDQFVDSLPAYLAATTRTAVETLQRSGTDMVGLFAQAGTFLSGLQWLNLPRTIDAITPVSLVAFSAIAALLILSLPRRRAERWLAARAHPKAPVRRLALLGLATLIDTFFVLLAAAAGHVASVIVSGGPPGLNQALFLNAFVLTELVKVGLAAFSSPYQPALRMTPFSDGQARYWYKRLSPIVSLLGYTFLFVAPVVQANSSLTASNAVRFIVVFAAFLTTIALILANRAYVGRRLARAYQEGSRTIQARFYLLLARTWWLFAAAFVTALFAVWISSPDTGFQFMMTASLKSIGAMALGGLLVTILTKAISHGIRVGRSTKQRFPLLESRINSFIPKLLFVIRLVVVLLVIGTILEAWSMLDFRGVLEADLGQRAIRSFVGAIIVLSLAFLVYLIVSSWVEYRLNPNYGTIPTARERTLLSLFSNAFTITLGVIVLMLVLSQLGINIAPLLAGAGVIGLAVGFGAQKFVQDIITGAFIQIENALNEGDVVQLGAVSGVVEKLTIRSVSLRALDGTYYLIPFSSVDQVANMTKDFSNFVADVEVAYREDVGKVKEVMREAFDELREGPSGPDVIADFEMLGVEVVSASAVQVRGRLRTLPGKQWAVGRLYREIVKRRLAESDVSLAVPQSSVQYHPDTDEEGPPPLDASKRKRRRSGWRPRLEPDRATSENPDGTPIPPDPKDDGDDDGSPR